MNSIARLCGATSRSLHDPAHNNFNGSEMRPLMVSRNSTLSRRDLLTRVAPALAGSLASISAGHFALAQENFPGRSVKKKIWSNEYWAKKDDLQLYVYRKRLGAPKAGEEAKPVLFLAHGSSVSS